MNCEMLARIQAYYDGELDAPMREQMARHVAGCAECSALLEELRGLSGMISGMDFPVMREAAMGRFRGSFHAARDRGVLRVASWLTGAAAVLLVGAILVRPGGERGAMAKGNAWEVQAVSPPTETHGESSELVQVAQWMADDLSIGGR